MNLASWRQIAPGDSNVGFTPISNGKVDGDKISFATFLSDGKNFIYEGTIYADEIKLTVNQGDGYDETLTLKRTK